MVDEKATPVSLMECHLSSIPGLDSISEKLETTHFITLFQAQNAKLWNFYFKPWLRTYYRKYKQLINLNEYSHFPTKTQEYFQKSIIDAVPISPGLKTGDLILVKSRTEIEKTLDVFHEHKGCAFLKPMYEYCGTMQRVYTKVERFLDERSFQVKSAKGLYFLDNLQCTGTAVFGRCDRRCYYFWRIEWMEKINPSYSVGKGGKKNKNRRGYYVPYLGHKASMSRN